MSPTSIVIITFLATCVLIGIPAVAMIVVEIRRARIAAEEFGALVEKYGELIKGIGKAFEGFAADEFVEEFRKAVRRSHFAVAEYCSKESEFDVAEFGNRQGNGADE